MTHQPTPAQMSRFWRSVANGRITHAKFERFLSDIETEPAPFEKLPSDQERHLRIRMAEVGKTYADILVSSPPSGDKIDARIRTLLLHGHLHIYRDPDFPHARTQIRTIQELVSMTDTEISRNKADLGQRNLLRLRRLLAQAGLRLGMSPQEIDVAFRPDPLPASTPDAASQTVEA